MEKLPPRKLALWAAEAMVISSQYPTNVRIATSDKYCFHNKCADIKVHVGFIKFCLFK